MAEALGLYTRTQKTAVRAGVVAAVHILSVQRREHMRECLCEFISNIWMWVLGRGEHGYGRLRHGSMESVLDTLTARQIQIEVLDRRCVSEARRHRASGSKMLFRAKMLEHRRLQGQLLQLQRYRESVMAQLDAVSNHEINQTFMRALRSVVGTKDDHDRTRKDAEVAMDEFQESMSQVKELSDFLGQPLPNGLEVSDEELEREFLDEVSVRDEPQKESVDSFEIPAINAPSAMPPLITEGRIPLMTFWP